MTVSVQQSTLTVQASEPGSLSIESAATTDTVEVGVVGPQGPRGPAISTDVLADIAYADARAMGYAVQNFDQRIAWLGSTVAFMKATVWPQGKIFLNRIPIPVDLTGLNGNINFAWRKFTGTGAANTFIGVYTYDSGTFTLQFTSTDQSAANFGSPNTIAAGSILQNIAADTPTTGFYIALLIGTQDSVGMGPCYLNSPTVAGSAVEGKLSTRTYPPAGAVTNLSSFTSLPSSLSSSDVSPELEYGTAWWAID